MSAISSLFGDSPVDIVAARALYGVHVASMPIWMVVGVWAVWKQRDLRAEHGPSKQLKPTVPTKGEYWAIRLLAAYTIMDFLRGADLCFDSTDGVCRAVWGFVPWWFRCTAWVARDLALLGAIGFQLIFYLGWTHEALEWPAPLQLQRVMHATLVIVLCAVAASFYALVATNRQSWQAHAAMFVCCLNAVWAYTNYVLLNKVLPEMKRRLQVDCSLPSWVPAAMEEVRLAARLVLTANIAILIIFPAISAERIILRGAHHQAFYPGSGLNEWVGNKVPPLLADRPAGIQLNPALEVVELLIGWLQFVYVLRMGRAPSTTRIPLESESEGDEEATPFHDEASLGRQFRLAAFGVVGKKGQ